MTTDEPTGIATSTGGTDLAYRRHGNGPPLVIVHGGLGRRAVASRLAERFDVLVYDRRGRGGSGDGRGTHSLERRSRTPRRCSPWRAPAPH